MRRGESRPAGNRAASEFGTAHIDDTDGWSLPVGHDAEAAVVGALIDNLPASHSAPLLAVFADDDVADTQIRQILAAVRRLVDRGITPDPVLVMDEVQAACSAWGEHRVKRISDFLIDVHTVRVQPTHLPFYMAIVVGNAYRRHLRTMADVLNDQADNGTVEAAEWQCARLEAERRAILDRLNRLRSECGQTPVSGASLAVAA